MPRLLVSEAPLCLAKVSGSKHAIACASRVDEDYIVTGSFAAGNCSLPTPFSCAFASGTATCAAELVVDGVVGETCVLALELRRADYPITIAAVNIRVTLVRQRFCFVWFVASAHALV